MLVRGMHTLFPSNTRGYHFSRPASLDARLLNRLHGAGKHLLDQVVREQKSAGYNPDHWHAIRLDAVTSPVILQSLANGANSLCRLTNLSVESFEHVSFPDGSSMYFSSVDAFSRNYRIHPKSPGASPEAAENDHYAAATQTRPHDLFGYRAHLGLFSLKNLLNRHRELSEITIAIADIKANPEFGQGEAKQIAVPLLLLPLIHTCCTRIITHADNHGIRKIQSTLNPRTGIIEWDFEDRSSVEEIRHDVIHMMPSGQR